MTNIRITTLAALLLLTTPLMAQSETAKIKGQVTDETGAMTQQEGWTDEQIKAVTGKAPATSDQGTFDEAERTLQRSSMGDDTPDATPDEAPDTTLGATPDATPDEAPDTTLGAKPDRKTQGEAED